MTVVQPRPRVYRVAIPVFVLWGVGIALWMASLIREHRELNAIDARLDAAEARVERLGR